MYKVDVTNVIMIMMYDVYKVFNSILKPARLMLNSNEISVPRNSKNRQIFHNHNRNIIADDYNAT